MAAAGTRERGEPVGPGEPGRRALYFCGSIRGGRDDRALYGRIVSRLRRFGVVLTEHVAAAELGARGEAAGRGRRGGSGRVRFRFSLGPVHAHGPEPALLPGCSLQRPCPNSAFSSSGPPSLPS